MAFAKLFHVAGTSSNTPTIDYVNDDVVSEIGGLISSIFGWITANPLLTVFLTMSMIAIGFVVIGWLKGVVKLH